MPRTAQRWVSVGEAARLLGLSRTTLLAAEEAGLIAAARTPGGHRRYRHEELLRYAEHAGGGLAPDPPAAAPPAMEPPGTRRVSRPPQPGPGRPVATGPATCPAVVLDTRAALRPVVKALGATSAGLYLLDAHGTPAFCSAYGVPRWLTDRLAASPAPPLVRAALGAGTHRLFDAAAAGFPDPRSTGRGTAVSLPRDGDPIGVLFVIAAPGRDLIPAELATIDAFADVLALVVSDRLRIVELQERLRQIAGLAG